VLAPFKQSWSRGSGQLGVNCLQQPTQLEGDRLLATGVPECVTSLREVESLKACEMVLSGSLGLDTGQTCELRRTPAVLP
jgi:hypothetical protein